MYQAITTPLFEKKFSKLTKNNPLLRKQIYQTVETLKLDPYYAGLKTHKVNFGSGITARSSRVTGDIRLIWNFTKEKLVILLLNLGPHSGSKKVYK
ncbi:MAG: type II toxin-antitoxin system mRNA interferase toxin, RelE/StbE family [Candidatus Shapirobacteria bacterium]|jgi:mRNA-degrading endonuclease YafQ of YafQ-DinJ toxin-antitoxin module